ncbi:hypothetical protein ADUPG1_000253 [Aduncisulcus paluster]|uniref:Reverse transcriptase/retrotransposon-derived protein RNase H-like domain-containing protein n=1 Tax=Aduncisulcus paluster TaxID=2918883 RepID=A0ABQ5K5S2_9EUKA|nr:hypothetical protein ADUPG1_000253 [Aduncisulcus paluster]
MALVLGDLRTKGCLTYLDDVLIVGKTRKEFIERLSEVIKRFKDHNFIFMDKSIFAAKEIRYLGFQFTKEGKQITAERQQAIDSIALPENKRALRRFLGIINYVKDFIPNLSVEASPFGHKNREKHSFIKDLINNSTSLSLFDPAAPLALFTDASCVGIGAVLKQQIQGVWYPVQYISKKFSAVQRRWSTLEQEAYGIVYAVKNLDRPTELDLTRFKGTPTSREARDYVLELTDQLKSRHEFVRKHWEEKVRKKEKDLKEGIPVEKGDFAWLSPLMKDKRKESLKFRGPVLIKEIISPSLARIMYLNNNYYEDMPMSRLKRVEGEVNLQIATDMATRDQDKYEVEAVIDCRRDEEGDWHKATSFH